MATTIESTLAIIKPDAFPQADAILDILNARGFVVADRETLTLTDSRAADFYREHAEKPFFPALIAYITSGPVLVLVLRKQNAIADLRIAVGPTDPAKAKSLDPHSIRAQFGTDITKNAVHASDAHASAAREIAFFFPPHTLPTATATTNTTNTTTITTGKAAKDYLNAKVAPILTKALHEMCLVAPADPVLWLGHHLVATATSATGNTPTTTSHPQAEHHYHHHHTNNASTTTSPPQPKVYFVLGNAGSGKGTQCAKLVQKFGFAHLSAGDLLRAEVAAKSPDGELIDSYIKEGKIVPGEITLRLLKNAIAANATKPGILVDGFPRALSQAGAFEKDVSDFQFCLFFDCPEDELERRLLERGKSSGRTDDNRDSIRKRFQTFKTTCYPVIEYYEARGKVHRIDATGTVDAIFAEVCSFF